MRVIKVSSSNIAQVGYDDAIRELTVEFHSGKTWKYQNVYPETFKGLVHADSIGGYFGKFIKPHHKGQES